MPEFVAWQRPAITALANAAPTSARLGAELPITLHDDLGALPAAAARFLIAGPGDVAAVTAGQVIGRRPHPGALDAEEGMLAHVELAAADLPWRYSPVPDTPAGQGVRPWLVLVVGTTAEVAVMDDGQVQLTGAELFAAHPLLDSAAWAHVHDVPGRRFARVVCPRKLDAGHDYLAVLVPAWQATVAADGSTALADSWPTPTGSALLPCFDHWTFRTTTEHGDFATIAQRLEPLSPDEETMLAERQFGRARVTVGPLPDTTLGAGGALTVIPAAGDPSIVEPLPAAVADVVEPLASALAAGGRWVLTLPRYDAPWHAGPVDGEAWQWPPPGDDVVPDGWRRELRADPRHRGVAGLGAWTAIAWQDRIAEGAARQAGAVAAAAQRIRHLTLGLRASRSLWARVPAERLARLATLSPMLARLPAAGGSTLDAIAGRTPFLAAALFSSSARRMLRRRGPLARAAAPGATALAELIAAANRCPEPQRIAGDDAALLDGLADDGALEDIVARLRQEAGTIVFDVTGDERLAEEIRSFLDSEPAAAGDLIDGVREREPIVACRPLPDLGAFADSVAAAIDPTVARPVVVDRVLGSITGLRPPELAEPELAPELDIPLWKFLSDSSPDWLLPGSGDIPPDRVLAVQTNPAFVDALLIGANHQTLGELRWRNIPVTTRWTPLRRFWQRIDVAADAVATDIRPVVALATDQDIWTDASTLGDPSHLSDAAGGVNLVIVLHTELFRRYPATIVYLWPNPGGAATWGPVPDVDVQPSQRAYPTFGGTLTPDLVFFGFGVPPSAASDHWLVLEEPPPGYRFRYDPAAPTADGALFAERTFWPPVRVFFGNLL